MKKKSVSQYNLKINYLPVGKFMESQLDRDLKNGRHKKLV